MNVKSIKEAIDDYLQTIRLARSENTLLSYRTALENLILTLKDQGLDVEKDPVDKINEELVSWFARDLKDYAATTEQLYMTAAKGFLEYLVAEELADVNLSKVKLLIRQRTRRPGKRLPQFPAGDISRIVEHFESQDIQPSRRSKRISTRIKDRAFLSRCRQAYVFMKHAT